MSSVTTLNIHKVIGNSLSSYSDQLAKEEPLEIRMVHGAERIEKRISVTMRTPGNDEELATGFLFTEGIIREYSQIEKVYKNTFDENIITVEILPHVQLELSSLDRNFYTTSSCGVCGKASIDAIKTQCHFVLKEDASQKTAPELLYKFPDILRKQQEVFESTGGLHASALFDFAGNILTLREDVGRHNALDKLIGYSFKENILPLQNHILLLSGRASFELIQKAMMAGIGIVAAIGAPSSLAVELAKDSGMTLIGFLKENKMNIYCGEERVSINK